MANHIHLALQVIDIPLSRGMQNLSFRFIRWINWRQKRSGHLFQGRYKAVLVDGDSCFLELVRYIHLNPVRAGMVKVQEDYLENSHNACLGNEKFVEKCLSPSDGVCLRLTAQQIADNVSEMLGITEPELLSVSEVFVS